MKQAPVDRGSTLIIC
jgi:hypothetical protein